MEDNDTEMTSAMQYMSRHRHPPPYDLGNSARSSLSSSLHDPFFYYRKYKRLKKHIKNLVFINAAACDEVIKVEEKIAQVKEERRFMLRKLLTYQAEAGIISMPTSKHSLSSSSSTNQRSHPASHDASSEGATSSGAATSNSVKRIIKRRPVSNSTASTNASSTAIAGSTPLLTRLDDGTSEKHAGKDDKNKAAKELLETLKSSRSKKARGQKGSGKKFVPPLLLDSQGRPVFPMEIGELTVHSLGEIVYDRQTYHSRDSIYPAGFCVTRLYTTPDKLDQKCLYTCKISDEGNTPTFEISPEDSSVHIIIGSSPDHCHAQLLSTIQKQSGKDFLNPSMASGADFFGLSHPVVQNLIQSCPGSKRCKGYHWTKYEINKATMLESIDWSADKNPAVSFNCLQKLIQSQGIPSTVQKPAAKSITVENSSNLRSLLTGGSLLTTEKK